MDSLNLPKVLHPNPAPAPTPYIPLSGTFARPDIHSAETDLMAALPAPERQNTAPLGSINPMYLPFDPAAVLMTVRLPEAPKINEAKRPVIRKIRNKKTGQLEDKAFIFKNPEEAQYHGDVYYLIYENAQKDVLLRSVLTNPDRKFFLCLVSHNENPATDEDASIKLVQDAVSRALGFDDNRVTALFTRKFHDPINPGIEVILAEDVFYHQLQKSIFDEAALPAKKKSSTRQSKLL